MNIASIDCGVSGALAVLDGSARIVFLGDMPFIETGKKRQIAENAVRDLLRGNDVEHVVIERAQVMPSRRANGERVRGGVVSQSGYIGTFFLLRGICCGLEIRYSVVSPAVWRRCMLSGTAGDKGASLIRAGQLWPQISFLKKDHHLAEALLIGYYGLTQLHLPGACITPPLYLARNRRLFLRSQEPQ